MSEFPETYEEARGRFLEAAESAGLRVMRHRISSEESPELFQDYAFLRRDPTRLLIQISGTHGVEGYMGSAIQRAIVEEGFAAEGPSLLFVHALNPYGMAFYRRTNSENVDLNRNYRQGAAQPNPDYDLFSSYLNPSSRLEFFTGSLKALWQLRRIGKARATQAIAMGQARLPSGLFYMGDRIQREIYLLQEFLRAHAAEAKEIVAIDLHSGLGEFGGELLFVFPHVSAESPTFFERAFGRKVDVADPSAGYYRPQGLLCDALSAALPKECKLHYVLQEIGAHFEAVTLKALREENYEWHRRPKGALRPDQIRHSMMETFFPASPDWRKKAQALGVERWKQALKQFD